ncbi:MAG TPA: thiosulfate oxidation carrier protein SoxY [Paracoccaceae bacterium]|nr:thiosulfate oxidation carrier protein SoxY [Paracoccaceae bacterium]
MTRSPLTRRRFLATAAAGGLALPFAARAQVTDLEGFDPIWRGTEMAVDHFFPRATFERSGIHLDLPQHADTGSSVPMTLRIDAAMTPEDYPVVVHVLADGNPSPHVLSAWFTPACGRAELSTRIRLETTQTVTAVAQMSDGRHLRVDRDISVAFGACGQVGTGTNDDVVNFQPETRISVPEAAVRGEVFAVRGIISHPMETGMRYSPTHEMIRQRIVSRFGCLYNGQEIFRARLYPAIATNPYFVIHARAQDSGTITLTWYDMLDITYRAEAPLTVL